MQYEEFAGRVAVVTGGSEGLGQDFCRGLVEAGSDVFFCARNVERGKMVAESLGSRAHFFRADLTVPEEINAFISYVGKEAGHVDYLVNNVAQDDRIIFSDVTVEECERMWQVNLRSYIMVTRACLDLLRAGQGKSIVNIGTTNFMLGRETMMVLYNAMKSGIIGFSKSLARDLGHEGIRVNMVSPGWIMTEKQLREYLTEEDKEALLRDQALKFLLYPSHITPAVLFLLSSEARAITGQNLVVDAGKYMH